MSHYVIVATNPGEHPAISGARVTRELDFWIVVGGREVFDLLTDPSLQVVEVGEGQPDDRYVSVPAAALESVRGAKGRGRDVRAAALDRLLDDLGL